MRALLPGAVPERPRAVVLLLHGGAVRDARPVDSRSASLRRMRWLHRAIGPELAHHGCASALLRFSVRGWNADDAGTTSPVADAHWALGRLRAAYAGLPVVLLGHSMGARTALHAASDEAVVGVVGLAPWFPPGEPVDTLRGVHLTAAHGARDRVTSPVATRQLLVRAGRLAASTRYVDMGNRGHYLLAGARAWHRVAVDETLRVLPG